MDLNYLLCWMAGVSGATGLFVHLVKYGRRYKGWVAAYAAVVITLAVGLVVRSDLAGFASSAVWLLAIGLPLSGDRCVAALVARNRLDSAQFMARFVALVHPGDGWRQQPQTLRALKLIQNGQLDKAQIALEQGGMSPDDARRFIDTQHLRIQGMWEPLLDYLDGRSEQIAGDETARLLYMRALGETGRVEQMLQLLQFFPSEHDSAHLRNSMTLFAFAFSGRAQLVRLLFGGPLSDSSDSQRDYWYATAAQAAGDQAVAVPILNGLANDPDPPVRSASRHRLRQPLPVFDPQMLDATTRGALDRLETNVRNELRFGGIGRRSTFRPYATWTLMLANVAAFIVEPNGGESPKALVDMGALVVPTELVEHPLLRTLSAGFLHFGWLHLAVNLFGLWLLGSYMERVWGRARFVVCFAAALVGANLVGLCTPATLHNPLVMAGASGGVLGILGAAFAFVAVSWYRRRLSILAQQLRAFALVFAVQMLFDVMTPVVSSTLHLAGLAIGLAIGGLLAWTSREDDTSDPKPPPSSGPFAKDH